MTAALTPEGRLAGALVAIAGGVAAVGGSNALAFAAAAGMAAWSLALALGWANLRRLTVERELPNEVFAGLDAPGTLVVRNVGWLPASDVALTDGSAAARLDGVGPGVERRAPVSWRFGVRGDATLGPVALVSDFPFGWIVWRRQTSTGAAVLVYPTPLPGRSREAGATDAGEGCAQGRGSSEWIGVRPWRDGDSERRVHWPSSARTGDWMVVERGGATQQSVEVVLDGALPREAALSVAAWEVAAAIGPVGLHLDDRRFPLQTGRVWKRVLLEALARAPAAG